MLRQMIRNREIELDGICDGGPRVIEVLVGSMLARESGEAENLVLDASSFLKFRDGECAEYSGEGNVWICRFSVARWGESEKEDRESRRGGGAERKVDDESCAMERSFTLSVVG
jgi:hypothetical protein